MSMSISVIVLDHDEKYYNAIKSFLESRSFFVYETGSFCYLDGVKDVSKIQQKQNILDKIDPILTNEDNTVRPLIIADLFMRPEDNYVDLGKERKFKAPEQMLFSVEVASEITKRYPEQKITFMTSNPGGHATLSKNFYCLPGVKNGHVLFKKPELDNITSMINPDRFYISCTNDKCKIQAKFDCCYVGECFTNRIKNIYSMNP